MGGTTLFQTQTRQVNIYKIYFIKILNSVYIQSSVFFTMAQG